MRVCGWLVLVLGVSPLACEGPGEVDGSGSGALGSLGAAYLDYVGLLAGVDEFFCGCAVAAGDYADMRECIAAVGGPPIPPLLADCYAVVVDEHELAREWVECQIGAYLRFHDCAELAGCGGEVGACQAALAGSDCPRLPYEVDAALAVACLGYELPAPFVCGDGQALAPWLECDFWPDCADASDEHEACPASFTCASGASIPDAWQCDGTPDCPDADDEAGCPEG